MKNHAFAILATILLAVGAWSHYMQRQLESSRANARSLALKITNVEASHDTTRNVARENAKVARLLGDSLKAFEKLVVQRSQVNDRLDSVRSARRAASYKIGYKLGHFFGSLTRPRRDTTQFHIRQEPYTVDAAVIPKADSMTLSVKVELDTIPLTARIHCGPAGAAGIRPASMMITAPPWATVRFSEVEQDPGICNPGQTQTGRTRRRWISWAPVSLSVGRTIGPGQSGWSAQIGTALTFGNR